MIFRVWTQATVRADAWILMSRLVCLSVKGYGAVTLGIKLNSAEISPSKNYQWYVNPLRKKMQRVRLLLSHSVFSGQVWPVPHSLRRRAACLQIVTGGTSKPKRFLAEEAQTESWTDILNDAVCVWFVESDCWVVINNTESWFCVENNYNKLSHEGLRNRLSTASVGRTFWGGDLATGITCNAHNGISNNFGGKPNAYDEAYVGVQM